MISDPPTAVSTDGRGDPTIEDVRYPRDRTPNDRAALILAVQSAIDDIDCADTCAIEAQVAAFLCAAWPTLDSQNQ